MMRRDCLFLFVIAFPLVTASSCAEKKTLPPEAETALKEATQFELLSLDPTRDEEQAEDGKKDTPEGDVERFHGWKVLGKTTIDDAATRDQLIEAFAAGVEANDGTVANCFNPRHGIRVTTKGQMYEFVICFECFQVEWHINGQSRGFLITASPQPTFDRVLTNAQVPLPQKKAD